MMHFEIEEIENSPGLSIYMKIAAKKRADLFRQFRNGEKVTPKRSVWKRLKEDVLREKVGGRCMYCEWLVEGGGDLHVEHYRPKLAVTETDLGKLSEHRDVLDGHDGYWWLSYEWQNLTLSCAWCNSAHTDVTPTIVRRRRGRGMREQWPSHPGKANEFPVDGERVFQPCEEPVDPRKASDSEVTFLAPETWWIDLAQEQPLLLHPYFDDPSDHLELDEQIGVLRGKTLKGTRTIRVCDLNRTALVEARAKAAKRTARKIRALEEIVEELEEDRDDDEFSQLLRKLRPRRRLAPDRGKGFSFYVGLYLSETASRRGSHDA